MNEPIRGKLGASIDETDNIHSGNEAHDKTPSLSPDKVAECRQELTAYAVSLLGDEANDFGDFGSSVSITDITACQVYRMTLETDWENRELLRQERSFDGAAPEYPTVTGNGVDVWNYRLPSGSTQPAEYLVAGSEKTIACSKCGATGQVCCQNCGGRRYLPCPTCKTKKTLPCTACSRRGYTDTEELGGYRLEPCDCKGGTNWIIGGICNKCNGVGCISVKWFRTVRHSCQKCAGNGAVACSKCYRDGTVDCGTCDKRGEIRCSRCKGNRYTSISYLVVQQSFVSTTQTGFNTDSGVSPDTLELLLEPSDYDEVLNVSDVRSYNAKVPDKVNKWVREAVANARNATASGTLLLKHRLKVCECQVQCISTLTTAKNTAMRHLASGMSVWPSAALSRSTLSAEPRLGGCVALCQVLLRCALDTGLLRGLALLCCCLHFVFSSGRQSQGSSFSHRKSRSSTISVSCGGDSSARYWARW